MSESKKRSSMERAYDLLIGTFGLLFGFFVLACFYFLFTGFLLRAFSCFLGTLLSSILLKQTQAVKDDNFCE